MLEVLETNVFVFRLNTFMDMNKEKGVSDTLQTNSLYIFFELNALSRFLGHRIIMDYT